MSLFIGIFSGLNLIFTIIIVGVFYLSVHWLWQNQQVKFVKQAPTLLTSLGIFGTFSGIVIALLGFDGVDNIKEQIDVIISGMQTAFITSVEGLLLSIILKILIIFKKDNTNQQDDATGEQLIQAFMKQTENSSQATEKLTQLLNAIGQDGDNSLIGQIRLMRSDFNDYRGHNKEFENKLWQEMDKVTETLAKSATETIIEALKDVIHDFNANLTEQFGENFKELNHAVHELVTWQENYRQQINAMTEQYTLGVQAINNTKEAVIKIEDSTKVIPDYMEDLGTILNDNQAQLNELTKHLKAFEDIRNKAVATLPDIQNHIESMLNDLRTGSDSIHHSSKAISDAINQTRELVRSQMNDLTENIQQTYKNTQTDINKILKETQENMSKTQEKTIVDMGTSLVSITTKFANDYAKLTEQMERVICQNGGFR